MREIICIEFGSEKQEKLEADEDEEVVGCLPRLLQPSHQEELNHLATVLPDVVRSGDLAKKETNEARFCKLLKLYQEQPNLLDCYIPKLVATLLSYISLPIPGRESGLLDKVSTAALEYLCHLSTVRGPKVVLKYLPHQVEYLHKLLFCLEAVAGEVGSDLFLKSTLLLWLSIVCKNPFDMKRFDPVGQPGFTFKRIICVSSPYLKLKLNKCHYNASLVLAQCLARYDGVSMIPEIITSCLIGIKDRKEIEIHGHLILLAAVLKHVDRKHLCEYVEKIIGEMKSYFPLHEPDALVRKLVMKIIQRCALVLLPPRLATWRYRRGRRKLEDSLQLNGNRSGNDTNNSNSKDIIIDDEGNQMDEDVNPIVEWVIGCVLDGIRDDDTTVRWSAAKAIGRITSRLPKYFASQVVNAVVDGNFHELAGHCSWHGGCMALGELSRRGYLLPSTLPKVFPLVQSALFYEEPMGRHALGSNVRDAACYILWAFARAYEPEQLRPYLDEVATSLMCSALFDREVKIRRAASAAFQENVGRQADFPDGIALLTIADYFAVGNRQLSYTKLSTKVVTFSKYSNAIIDHLVERKISHWDEVVREQAAEALRELAPYNPSRVAYFLPQVLGYCKSTNLSQRHGALLALAHSTCGLLSAGVIIDENLLKDAAELPCRLKSDFSNLRTGLVTRIGVTKFIKIMSELKLVLSSIQISTWLSCIELAVVDKVQRLRALGSTAAQSFFGTYSLNASGIDVMENAKMRFVNGVREAQCEEQRCGSCVMISVLPPQMLSREIYDALIDVIIRPKSIDAKWAIGRKTAIQALTQCFLHRREDRIDDIFESLIHSLDDYTKDVHGDVGRFVRQEAMDSLVTILCDHSTTDEIRERYTLLTVRRLIQQSGETIGRTRECACQCLLLLLNSCSTVPFIPAADKLLHVYRDSRDFILDLSLLKLSPLLYTEEYFEDALHGLVISAGAVSEVTKRYSRQVLTEYHITARNNHKKEEMLVGAISDLFSYGMKVSRIGEAVLKYLPEFLGQLPDDDFCYRSESLSQIIKLLKKVAMSRKASPTRIRLAIEALAAIPFSSSQVWQDAISVVAAGLASPLPVIRRTSAEALYTALCLQDIDEQVLQTLQETPWQDTFNVELILDAASFVRDSLLPIALTH